MNIIYMITLIFDININYEERKKAGLI